MQSPHIPVGRSPFDEIGEESYGLGFGVASYRGDKQVFHGGAWTGYSTLLTMLPERGVGVIVLSNRHEHPACYILAYSILDALCGHERIPWRDRFRSIEDAAKARRQDTDTPPIVEVSAGRRSGRALTDYIGIYDHPAYGRIGIEANGCGLRFIGLSLNSPLRHREGEIFELEDEPAIFLEGLAVTFRAGIAGDIDQISLPLEPKVPEIAFKRLQSD